MAKTKNIPLASTKFRNLSRRASAVLFVRFPFQLQACVIRACITEYRHIIAEAVDNSLLIDKNYGLSSCWKYKDVQHPWLQLGQQIISKFSKICLRRKSCFLKTDLSSDFSLLSPSLVIYLTPNLHHFLNYLKHAVRHLYCLKFLKTHSYLSLLGMETPLLEHLLPPAELAALIHHVAHTSVR